MRLLDLLSEDVIRASLEAPTREAAIDELVDVLVASGALPAADRDRAARAVHKREASATTGLGSGVAVPHGVCDGVGTVTAALGIHRGGVDFAAVDGKPVHLVILLLVPPNMFQAHIRTLAGIARLLNDPSLRRLLLAAPDARTVMQILEQREGALPIS
jgi:nitrogen PTS system EIIA component